MIYAQQSEQELHLELEIKGCTDSHTHAKQQTVMFALRRTTHYDEHTATATHPHVFFAFREYK